MNVTKHFTLQSPSDSVLSRLSARFFGKGNSTSGNYLADQTGTCCAIGYGLSLHPHLLHGCLNS